MHMLCSATVGQLQAASEEAERLRRESERRAADLESAAQAEVALRAQLERQAEAARTERQAQQAAVLEEKQRSDARLNKAQADADGLRITLAAREAAMAHARGEWEASVHALQRHVVDCFAATIAGSSRSPGAISDEYAGGLAELIFAGLEAFVAHELAHGEWLRPYREVRCCVC